MEEEAAAEEGAAVVSAEVVDNSSESNQTTAESNRMGQPETAGAALGPADDPMLGFLTLLAKVERPACANCESKDLSPMFFCNTCGNLSLSIAFPTRDIPFRSYRLLFSLGIIEFLFRSGHLPNV